MMLYGWDDNNQIKILRMTNKNSAGEKTNVVLMIVTTMCSFHRNKGFKKNNELYFFVFGYLKVKYIFIFSNKL